MRRGFAEILPRSPEHDGVERAVGRSDGKRHRAYHDAAATAATDRKYSVESDRETARKDQAWQLEAHEGEVLGQLQTVG